MNETIFQRIRLVTLVFACLGAACAGPTEPSGPPSRTASPGSPPPETRALDPDRPVILAFGDSLTHGYMVDEAESYPARLQARLTAGGYPHQVINDGEDGLTTSGALARLGHAIDLDPEIVIVELGGNDGLRGLPIGAATENLRAIVRAFQDQGARVILAGLTLPRNYGPEYIADFESMYADLADELEVERIPFFLEGLVDLEDPAASIGVTMQANGTHPTAAGYEIVADTVFHAIEPYLKD